jgi:uncharacterized membrane protein
MDTTIEFVVYAMSGLIAICLYEIVNLHAKIDNLKNRELESLRNEMLCRIAYATEDSMEALAAKHYRRHQNDDMNELLVQISEETNSSKTQENG